MPRLTQIPGVPGKYTLIIGGVAVVVVGYGVYKFMQKIGLIKTKEEEAAAAAAASLQTGAAANPNVLDPKNPAISLNPNYWLAILAKWKKDNKITNPTISQLNKLLNPLSNGKTYNINLGAMADLVYNANKVWFRPDTEDQVFAAFRTMRNQAQVSKMSGLFLDTFKTDLFSFIQTFMNDMQQAQLFAILKNKPLL